MRSTTTIDHTGYTYNVVTTISIPEEMIVAMLQHDGTAYWAERAHFSNGIATWWEQEAHRYNDDGTQSRMHTATYERIAEAMTEVADGQHTNTDIANECAYALREGSWTAGSDVADCVIQAAMFGKVIYG